MTPIPVGFRCHRRGEAVLFVDDEFEAAALEIDLLGLRPGADLPGAVPVAGGRGSNSIVRLPGRSERLHLRPFHHGGWLRPITRDRLTSLRRPLAELAAGARLVANAAPVARPVLALGCRRGPGFWNTLVGSLHEESTRDGIAFFAAAPNREPILAAAAATGTALRAFHEAGGRHADLHLGNILLREGGGTPEVVFVDLDRARVTPRVPPRRRLAEMLRLYRSVHKRGAANAITPEAVAHFFAAYCDGDVELRAALLAGLPRERLRFALHRVGRRARPAP